MPVNVSVINLSYSLYKHHLITQIFQFQFNFYSDFFLVYWWTADFQKEIKMSLCLLVDSSLAKGSIMASSRGYKVIPPSGREQPAVSVLCETIVINSHLKFPISNCVSISQSNVSWFCFDNLITVCIYYFEIMDIWKNTKRIECGCMWRGGWVRKEKKDNCFLQKYF